MSPGNPSAAVLMFAADDAPALRLSPWSRSRAKRVFDLICAVPLTVLMLPLMGVLALLVLISSPGPILFRQRRCGKDGREFELLKFRSMRHWGPPGPGVTSANDARITRLGRLLRNTKLDELPQLVNVLRGDMSFVGPRPDLGEYFAECDPRWRQVLQLRPGITGWATLRYRHEEELLASVAPEQLKEFYVRVLLPKKARLDLAYGKHATFWTDLGVLFRTLKIICS